MGSTRRVHPEGIAWQGESSQTHVFFGSKIQI